MPKFKVGDLVMIKIDPDRPGSLVKVTGVRDTKLDRYHLYVIKSGRTVKDVGDWIEEYELATVFDAL